MIMDKEFNDMSIFSEVTVSYTEEKIITTGYYNPAFIIKRRILFEKTFKPKQQVITNIWGYSYVLSKPNPNLIND